MKISIIGCGYVGLVTGVCLADKHNHEVYFIDRNFDIISNLRKGKIHIHEKNLREKFNKQKKNKKIFFSSNIEDNINKTQITIVCVGTPNKKNGSIDLTQVKKCTQEIGKIIKNKKNFHIVVYKSTILPGTINEICTPLLEEHSNKKVKVDFGVASNPEFLREGTAVKDFEYPSRIIIGSEDSTTKNIINRVYKRFLNKAKIINVDIKTSEMIKYFNNSFYSLLISFGNEFGNLCSKEGLDFMDIIYGFKYDDRLKKNKYKEPEFIKYLYPGIGYGGSCFPKDIKALIDFSKKRKSTLTLLEKTNLVNDYQPKKISNKILSIINKKNIKKVLVLGITFKENSDDIRNSTSIKLINYLLKNKINVSVHDPLIKKNKFNEIKFYETNKKKINFINNKNLMNNFEMIIINNRTEQFKKIINKIKAKKNIIVYDSRRYFQKKLFKNYYGSGV
jgi:UDPglucose 6-dehydrogenase